LLSPTPVSTIFRNCSVITAFGRQDE